MVAPFDLWLSCKLQINESFDLQYVSLEYFIPLIYLQIFLRIGGSTLQPSNKL